MKNNISEKYRKYLIKIINEKTVYFTVWGTNIPTENDFLLLETNYKIHCFTDKYKLKLFLKSPNINLPDTENFSSWVNKYSFNKEYSTYRINNININDFDMLISKNRIMEIIDNINIINDFAIQSNNIKLIKLHKKRHLKKMWNEIYNNFFWTQNQRLNIPFDELKKAIEIYNHLVLEFIKNIHVE